MSPLQADLSLNVAHLEDKIKLRIMQDWYTKDENKIK
jgi:hypothetical protein